MILFSQRRRRERAASERLYAAVVEAARQPALYGGFGVPDTLQGRFEMMALHLFAVVHRLMHDPGDDPQLARLLAERFVADMDAAFRDLGVSDTRVPKRMTALYGSFAGRLGAYKAGLESAPPALAEALARNIFPEGPAHRAAALAEHLGATVAALRAAPLQRLQAGEATFPPPLPRPQEETSA